MRLAMQGNCVEMDSFTVEPTPAVQRSGEILDRIKSVFAAKGFDGASMQDLAQAAGMSAGNFYRYFPSKNAIIEALAQRNLERIEADFAIVRKSAEPMRAFRELLHDRVQRMACEDAPIWAEIQASAFRKPEIAALQRRMESQVVASLLAIFAHLTGHPVAVAEQRFGLQARLVILLVQSLSCAMPPNVAGREADVDRELVSHVLRMIEETVQNLPQSGTVQADQEG